MKKTKITFYFKDETKNYEVKPGRFIVKCLVCLLIMFFVISAISILPDELDSMIYRADKNRYKSYCEEMYVDRDYEELYDEMHLYRLSGEDYDMYWEMVYGFADYTMYKEYEAIADREQVSLTYALDDEKNNMIQFDVTEKLQEYRKKVIQNANNCKYERNKRYLTEFADKVK